MKRIAYSASELRTISILEYTLLSQDLDTSADDNRTSTCPGGGLGSPNTPVLPPDVIVRPIIFITQGGTYDKFRRRPQPVPKRTSVHYGPTFGVIQSSVQMDVTYSLFLDWRAVFNVLTRTKPSLFDFELAIPATMEAFRMESQLNFVERLQIICWILANEITRCRRISIQVNLNSTAAFFCDSFQKLCEPALNLQELIIEVNSAAHLSEQSASTLNPLFAKNILPNLTSARIGACFCLPSRCKNLTSFHFDTGFMTFRQLHFILSRLHSLRILALYNSFASEEDKWDFELTALILPSLTSLQLYDHTPLAVDVLLCLIFTSKLHDLVIGRLFWGSFGFFHSHCATRHASVRKITFVLHGWWSVDCDVFGIRLAAQCFPNVRHIAFYGSHPHMALEVLQTPDETGHLPFPKLRSIALESAIPLCEFLEARRRNYTPIFIVYLTEKAAKEQRDMAWLVKRVEVSIHDFLEDYRSEGLYYRHRKYGRVT